MYEVIIETARKGGGTRRPKGQRKREAKGHLPKQEGMRRRWSSASEQKFFNDVLGPVRRFLRSRCGRPWNKVYSEICQHVDKRSVAQKHLLTHVWQFVERNVTLVDGVPYVTCGRMWRPAYRWFYICPSTGLLKSTEQVRKQQPHEVRRLIESDTLQYHRLQGIWHKVTLRPVPSDASGCCDAVTGELVTQMKPGALQSLYGRGAYALSKRPLSREEERELRKEIKRRSEYKRGRKRRT